VALRRGEADGDLIPGCGGAQEGGRDLLLLLGLGPAFRPGERQERHSGGGSFRLAGVTTLRGAGPPAASATQSARRPVKVRG